MVLFEESPDQVLRNMRSLGLDLRPWVDAGLLRIWAARPSAFGLEAHLAMLARLIEEEPAVGGGAGRDRRPGRRGDRLGGGLDGGPPARPAQEPRGSRTLATALAAGTRQAR